MKILVAHFSLTGNTSQVAQAIYKAVVSREHEVTLSEVAEVTAERMNDYDLVYLGSSCHDTDVAKPVKHLLEDIEDAPPFRLAGFVTHATQLPEDGEKEMYEQWAGNCIRTFQRASKEKHITFLGYFHCKGRPSAPIAQFIHNTIITADDKWTEYITEVQGHPDSQDLSDARAFANRTLSNC